MNKKAKILFLLIVAIASIWLVLNFVAGNGKDIWICEDGQWIQDGNPSSKKPTNACPGEISQVTFNPSVQLEMIDPSNRVLITVNNDGEVEYESINESLQEFETKTVNVSQADYAELVELINNSGFYELEGEYKDEALIDGATYTIKVTMEDDIEIVSCLGECPEEFTNIKNKIEKLYGGDIINIDA